MRFVDSRILIFAKPPLAGQVNTRLFPLLDPEASAGLHIRMLSSLVQRLGASEIAPVELYCAAEIDHPVFVDLAKRHGLVRRAQADGDLGERMGRAAGVALETHARVVLVGTDCPGIDGDYLARLLDRLSLDCPVVIGPAEDGGYVALGLSRFDRRLFEEIDWGSDRVLAQTQQRLRELNWSFAMMPPLWDVDRPADLERLRRTHPELVPELAAAEGRAQTLARE